MHVVALLAQKGGVGKTTLAVSLAVQAELAGFRSGIVDADPQANAAGWFINRQKKQKKESPVVASVNDPAKVHDAVSLAREEGFDWLFIDTPAGVQALPATSAAVADLILIPCVPSGYNMEALAATVRLVKQVQKPGFFIINRGNRSKAINDECALALTSAYGLPAVNTHVLQRQPIADGELLGTALPEMPLKDSSADKGKDEFRALWSWLASQFDGGKAHG